MESLLQSIEVTGQIELVKIIQELLIRFGNDATELVTQMLEKGTAIEAVKINTLSSVKTATGSSVKIATGSSVKTAPLPSTINHAALCKIEKKEKSKKDFDMSRYYRYVPIRYNPCYFTKRESEASTCITEIEYFYPQIPSAPYCDPNSIRGGTILWFHNTDWWLRRNCRETHF